MLRKYGFIIMLLIGSVACAQENWMLKGYVKGMTSMQTVEDNGEMSLENTLHNRFDINWFVNDNITVTVGLRNRVIIGNNVIWNLLQIVT